MSDAGSIILERLNMSHARVMPSKLDLTVKCPGSLQLQESVPPCPPTFEQAEGTGAHTVALKVAIGAGADWRLGRKFTVDRHELKVDDDMLDGAMLYADETHSDGRFEDTVAIPDVHPECFGTPDYWKKHVTFLHGLDYKYGHRFVDAFENYQLIAYMSGVSRKLELPARFHTTIGVVQPRAYGAGGPVREWESTVGEVIEICHDVINPKVQQALGPNPPTMTGRHCLDCTARHACKTLQNTAANLVDFSGTAEQSHLSNAVVGQELRILKEAIKRLESRYTGLYEQASNMARSGVAIPHWGLESADGRLAWTKSVPVDHLAAVGDLMGVDIRKPTELVTPTQAIKAGIDASVIHEYSSRPRGAMRLVQDDSTALRKIIKGS